MFVLEHFLTCLVNATMVSPNPKAARTPRWKRVEVLYPEASFSTDHNDNQVFPAILEINSIASAVCKNILEKIVVTWST